MQDIVLNANQEEIKAPEQLNEEWEAATQAPVRPAAPDVPDR